MNNRHETQGTYRAESIRKRFIFGLRQWCFPKEFRIAPAPWQSDLVDRALEELCRTLVPEGVATVSQTPHTESSALSERFLADLATNVWRLRQKMLQPGTDQPLEEMRRVYRHVEAIWDSLNGQGVEICGHTGEVLPQGGVYGLKVLACQPTSGTNREHVLETIKPTIRLGGRIIQMGEVILAVPEKLAAYRGVSQRPAAARDDKEIPTNGQNDD